MRGSNWKVNKDEVIFVVPYQSKSEILVQHEETSNWRPEKGDLIIVTEGLLKINPPGGLVAMIFFGPEPDDSTKVD